MNTVPFSDTLHFAPPTASPLEVVSNKVAGLTKAISETQRLMDALKGEVIILQDELRKMRADEKAASAELVTAAKSTYDYLSDMEQALEEAKRVKTLLGAVLR
jgi:predicted  nucleic acid-binding Zn-ribbon protein